MIVRGNRIHRLEPALLDATWNAEDCARFATLRARYADKLNVEMVRCMVWKAKVPGLMYPSDIEATLQK